jgi:hypothetical protein
MKVRTATKDRGLLRPKPHTPCPEVHPFPSLVPNPVSSPPRAKAKADGMGTLGSSELRRSTANCGIETDTIKKVVRKARLQRLLGSDMAFVGFVKMFAMIPLAPKISPLSSNKDAAERPIIDPPIVPVMGVKYSNMMEGIQPTRKEEISLVCSVCGVVGGFFFL